MRKTLCIIFIPFIVMACSKSDTIPPVQSCYHKSGEISGNWILNATRHYDLIDTDTTWQPEDGANLPTIKFIAESNFYYSNTFEWSNQKYDRYSKTGSVSFRIYSTNPPTGGFPLYPIVNVQVINANEIVLTYQGIDKSTQERYNCFKDIQF